MRLMGLRWLTALPVLAALSFIYAHSPAVAETLPPASATTTVGALTFGVVSDSVRLDASGNTLVNCAVGCSSASGAPLPGGTSTATAANQSIGVQAWDGSANLVPLKETTNALWVNCQAGCSSSGGAPLTGASQNVTPAASQSAGVHIARMDQTKLDALQQSAFGMWTTTGITASGSPQSVGVTTGYAPYIAINSWVWLGAKTDNAEYVQVTAEADTSHITAIFSKNHSAGDLIIPAGNLNSTVLLSTLNPGGLQNGAFDMPVTGAAAFSYAYCAACGGTNWQPLTTNDTGGSLNVRINGITNGAISTLSAQNRSSDTLLETGAFLIGNDSGTSNSSVIRDRLGELQTTVGGNTLTKIAVGGDTACTSISTSAATLHKVWSSAGSETQTLSLYNEAASPTCAAADLVWSGIPSNTAPISLDAALSLGLAAKFGGTSVNITYVTSN